MQITISEPQQGMRADKIVQTFLSEEYSGTKPRSHVKQYFNHGWVSFKGQAIKPSYKVQLGDALLLDEQIMTHQLASNEYMLEPENIPVDIVDEDEHFIVVNKAAQMVTMPAPGNWTGTLVNALCYLYPEMLDIPRNGIVHRIDKGTTGLLVVARTQEGYEQLGAQVAARSMKRQYLAICRGVLNASQTIDKPIGRHPHKRNIFLTADDGRHAITHIAKLEEFRAHTLMRATLETGRTHQIRVHMQSIGHPLLGDVDYGGWQGAMAQASHKLNSMLTKQTHQVLHAAQLTFQHPVSHRIVENKAKLPDFVHSLYQELVKDTEEHVY